MKVSLGLFCFLLCFLSSLTTFSQQKLTKDEILKEYQIHRSDPSQDSLYRWDIHLQIRSTFDDLILKGVDTLIVYTEHFPGYGSVSTKKDTCSLAYPIQSYFFWKKNGKSFAKTVDGKCESEQLSTNSKVTDFVVENYPRISKEFFMGVIYSVEKRGNKLHVFGSSISHEPKYTILTRLGSQYKYLSFTEDDLENKESLFHDYNKGLISYKLFKLIQTEIVRD